MPTPPPSPSVPSPWRRRWRAVRRQVLLRRRTLAVLLLAAALASGLRAVSAPAEASVAVVVAARDLPAGRVLEPDDLTSLRLPRDAVPAGAVVSGAGRVLASPLRRGEPVTDVRLVSPALAAAQPGASALPVRLPDAGVAALLRPGDEVDLIATDPAGGTSRSVATDVRVLAVPDPGHGGTDGAAGALVVLEVSGAEALSVTGASLSEFLSVAL